MLETNETALLLACARTRIEDLDAERIRSLCGQQRNWPAFLNSASANRMGPMLFRNLRECAADAVVPPDVLARLKMSYGMQVSRNDRLEEATRAVLGGFEKAGIEALLLRGALVGEVVYGDPVLRPYTDLDVLIRKEDLPRAKEQLKALGYGPLAHALEDRYYERHHLHLEYRHANGASVEIHWALDHPYSLFNIPCGDLLGAARPGAIAGGPARILAPEHLLLTLCIHFVKHACGLPALLAAPGLSETLARNGWLMHLCDVAETLRRFESALNWTELTRVTAAWNIGRAVDPSLRAAVLLLDAPVPEEVLRDAPQLRPNWIERRQGRIAAAAASPSTHVGAAGFRPGLFVRPVRMFEALSFVWPEAGFLAGRYGAKGPVGTGLCRVGHSVRAVGSLVRNAVDYLYFAARRSAS